MDRPLRRLRRRSSGEDGIHEVLREDREIHPGAGTVAEHRRAPGVDLAAHLTIGGRHAATRCWMWLS